MHNETRAAVERAARDSYGRLLALLAMRARDVAAAEDALGDALAAALRVWPDAGVPDNPTAWLFATARNRLIDAHRKHRTQVAATLALAEHLFAPNFAPNFAPDFAPDHDRDRAIPDERLRLMFVCAHPAIDPAARTPLMLQTVLGLDAARIASAFLVPPATMAQRLVRAKVRIRKTGLRFEAPEPADLGSRLEAVMEAIYAAFGQCWQPHAGRADRPGLAAEAIWLAQVLTSLLPDEPEPIGLLSLMLFCEARHAAHRTAASAYVPLQEQDRSRWSRPTMIAAETLLGRAAAFRRPGRFQLEAALQSLHMDGAVTGRTDWLAAVVLYDALIAISPTIGARVGRAAAIGEAVGPQAGLEDLERIEAETYQPWWALAAHLNARLGRRDAAASCYSRAADLTDDPAIKAFLAARASALPRLA